MWEEHVTHWRRLNARFVTISGDERSPSVGHEYLLYQTLIGVWPHGPISADFVERIEAYAVKAAREGKLETGWISPNEDYEKKLTAFVRRMLDRTESLEFLDTFETFARRTTLMGGLNSLSQLALKALMPGVPDFYQGTELWDLSLVDPDNRRPVDFEMRREALAADANWSDLAGRWMDGHLKLALTRKLLQLRNQSPALFREGRYEPVEVTGPDRDHVIAFMRRHGNERLLVVAGRHFAALTDQGNHWPTEGFDAEIAVKADRRTAWHNALTPGVPASLACRKLLGGLPIAVLASA
jgi:(1->4)-alpha-D-glucan 1-alpha-D-glucosylmutase